MTGKEIADIVIAIGFTSWIPIFFFFGGIAKVVNAIKGNTDTNNGINVDVSYDDKNDEESENMDN